MTLQYGIVPTGHDYFNVLESDPVAEKMLDDCCPVLDETASLSQVIDSQ